MSVRPYYDVWCDIEDERCIGWEQTATSPTRRDVRPIAKAHGWSTIRRDGKTPDVCPNCKDRGEVQGSASAGHESCEPAQEEGKRVPGPRPSSAPTERTT